MKNALRYLYALAALLLLVTGARAGGTVNVVKQFAGNVSPDAGQVTFKVEDGVCKLTITPAEGNYVTVEYIRAIKLVQGNVAHAPRHAPDFAEEIEVRAVNTSADLSGVTEYIFDMPDPDYDVEVTVDFQVIRLKIGNTVVHDCNRLDILNNGGKVMFDGKNTLLLIDAKLEDLPILSSMDKLIIHLKESNYMSGTNSPCIMGNGGVLSFTTNGNEPGKLTLDVPNFVSAVTGFSEVQYSENLSLITNPEGNFTIGSPINPIIDDVEESHEVDIIASEGQAVSNNTYDDLLYTLEEGNGDGYDSNENCIVLSSTMIESNVEGTIAQYQPGSEDFAENFNGLTFMVPAGTGNIYLTCKTGEEGVLNVKIGNNSPTVIAGVLEFSEFIIPYACSNASYVYIYNASTTVAQAPGFKRAAKKAAHAVGISGLGTKAVMIQQSNNASMSQRHILTPEDILLQQHESSPLGNRAPTATVTNPEVTDLPDRAFEQLGYVSFIDLRATGLTGVEVSRSEGPFAGVSKNTFIYLPAGNRSDEPNVVIGQVCNHVVLNGDMPDGESFELAGDSITAASVVYDCQLSQDQLVTVYLPFAIDREHAAAMGSFYTLGKVAGGQVEITKVKDDLKAHTPYLFRPAADLRQLEMGVVALDMPEQVVAASIYRAWGDEDGLYGSYLHYHATDEHSYRLATGTDQSQTKFLRMQGSDVVKPFHAYLRLKDSEVDELVIIESSITGIHDATADESADAPKDIYNLNGMNMHTSSLASLPSGIYIVNGKKVVK